MRARRGEAPAERAHLPLTGWAMALCAAGVTASGGATLAALAASGELSPAAAGALGVGALAGLLVGVVGLLGARQVSRGLRGLQADALARLHDPSGDRSPRRRAVGLAEPSEVADLERTMQALARRVRLGDSMVEQHRRAAETAAAGVFELVSGLVTAEEGARGQLAAELHDTVAQSLMIARGLLETNPSTPQEVRRLRDYVEDAEEQVRAVMARTRPPALRDGDLASAVVGLQTDMAVRYALVVHLSWPRTAHPLPLATAVTLYRFFQETLLNVVKHAGMDDAFLSLSVDGAQVRAQVRDEGPGFDPAVVRPDRGRHVGLDLLRERARLSGGELVVRSAPGAGTSVTLTLPLPQRPGRRGIPVPAPRTARSTSRG